LVHGYVLIKTALGKALDVVAEVAKVEGIKSACAVAGEYDIVAIVEVEKLTEIAETVVNKIHGIEGVCSTQTLICVYC